uniref:FYVE, RhoGEF and PH domain containing 4b n=1 Tax=Cynoglossus semilaevis TaxID=244447 RepID=A0A3P8WIT0_CYNSE
MFDLKKRNSLTLNSSKEVEEFRRVAVRRKAKAAEVECVSQTVSSGVDGTYSCIHACDRVCGSELLCEKDDKKSPPQQFPYKPQGGAEKTQALPKPSDPQSPGLSPTSVKTPRHVEDDHSPNRHSALSVCINAANKCLISPQGGSCVSNGVFLAQNLTSSPISGVQSPGKRGFQYCSPLKEGGPSPAKLSPRSHNLLSGKLRTPSPVQGRIGSYSPSRKSRSWLGLNRISSGKMEENRKKSISVPDLIVYLDDSRIPSENLRSSPQTLLESSNSSGPAITINLAAKHKLNQTTDEGRLSTNGVERCREWPLTSGKRAMDQEGTGKEPAGNLAKVSCHWADSPLEGGIIDKDLVADQKDKEKMEESAEVQPKDDENVEQKLFRIATELLHTEKAYVARLHLLDQVFCQRLTEEAGRGSFPAEVIKNIFSNISSIYSFHSQFVLPDLENCLRHWSERPGLGHVLVQHAPFLRMYADYVRNFDQAMELVRTWTERSAAFRNVILDVQSQEVCGSLTLQHHMLEPIQRLPRYEMLLRDYLRRLPQENPDYELAHKSLEAISMAATHSNSAIHKAENRKRLLEIYEMVGEEEVVNPTNELLREGRLVKLAARNTSAMERHLFLFNNFLLCCTPRFCLVGQRFTVRCRIGVDGMHVQQTNNEDHPFTFQVSGKEKTLELQASSEQDRDEWIKVFQEAIDLFQKKNETFRLAAKEFAVEEPLGELGRRAPRWIRDNEVTVCMKCREPFNALTRRRHHCRACGCVVCWKCSDNKVALQYDGNKMNKVCKACYSVLTGQSGDSVERRTQESEESSVSGDVLVSGFLDHAEADSPENWQQVWTVLTKTEPPVVHLYTTPQDALPRLRIPLTGCSVEDSCEELQGQPCFRLELPKTCHVFSCDSVDLKQRWLTALTVAVTDRPPACPSIGSSAQTV